MMSLFQTNAGLNKARLSSASQVADWASVTAIYIAKCTDEVPEPFNRDINVKCSPSLYLCPVRDDTSNFLYSRTCPSTRGFANRSRGRNARCVQRVHLVERNKKTLSRNYREEKTRPALSFYESIDHIIGFIFYDT